MALQDKIVADGGTPWCIGLEFGRRHRLAGDRLGRRHPAAARSRRRSMTTGSTTRSSSTTRRSSPRSTLFGSIAKDDKNVAGGTKPRRAPRTSATARRASSPCRRSATCTTRRRSSRPSSPRAPSAGEDYDFFYFPPIEGARRPRQSGRRLGQPRDHHQGLAGRPGLHRLPRRPRSRTRSGWPSQRLPQRHQDGQHRDLSATTRCKKEGEILLNATTFRFDGSDLMPGADRRRRLLDRHGRLRRTASPPRTSPTRIQAAGTSSSNLTSFDADPALRAGSIATVTASVQQCRRDAAKARGGPA